MPKLVLCLALTLAATLPLAAAGLEGEESTKEVQPLDRLRELVELRLGSEALPPQVDPLGRRSYAELMLSLPVGDSLRLRGGTRVSLHEEPASGRSDLEALPMVGIQLRF